MANYRNEKLRRAVAMLPYKINTNSEAHRHSCEVKELARILYLSMYAKLISTRAENGDALKRRLDGVEKHRGKDAREILESDVWEFLRSKL